MLQKIFIRVNNSLSFNAHTSDFFKKNILRVNDLHKLSLAIFTFKKITNSTFNTNSDFHHYNTSRFRNILVIPPHNLTMTQKNRYIRAIKVWSIDPTCIKKSGSQKFFKRELKKHYIGL